MMVNLIRSDPDFLPERIRISSNYGELIKVLDPSAPQTAGMKSVSVR